jgi:transposase
MHSKNGGAFELPPKKFFAVCKTSSLHGITQTPIKQIFSRTRKTPRKISKKKKKCDIKTPQANHHKNHNKGKMEELERLKNQKEFREILAKYGITQDQAAALIKKETNQKVGTRKVRSWLANLEAKSARSCPNWAVTALKKATIDLEVVEQKESEQKDDK